MTNVRESSTTAWLETIRGFFIPDDEIENEVNKVNTDKGYQEWKKTNADIIDEKAIVNLEKMVEHNDRQKQGEKQFRKINGSNNIRYLNPSQTEIINLDDKVKKLENAGKKGQSRGA